MLSLAYLFFFLTLDVIGVVEEFEQVRKIPTKFGDKDIVRFRLCDGRLMSFAELSNFLELHTCYYYYIFIFGCLIFYCYMFAHT